ncbi:MAG: hypothetical protein LBV68_04700 [Spirochaetaceae bacterium]|jgi:RsiW-degrading membrane proteinase PrsW (M82 family)|nr:hypothetical protein [Spirochaetaceae bacterium]
MSGIVVVLILVSVSFLPVGLSVLWFRRRALSIPPIFFLVFLAGGVLSLILALLLQSVIPQNGVYSKWTSLFDLFIRISASEEGARLVILFVIFHVIGVFYKRGINNHCPFGAPLPAPMGEIPKTTRYTPEKPMLFEGFAAGGGLLLGLSFAAVESAVYATANPELAVLRMISSIPLHAACGIRCGIAAFSLYSRHFWGIRHFIFAIVLHSFFNFMLPFGGLRAALGILLALSSLASSARLIGGPERSFLK